MLGTTEAIGLIGGVRELSGTRTARVRLAGNPEAMKTPIHGGEGGGAAPGADAEDFPVDRERGA